MPDHIPHLDSLPDLRERLARAKVLYTDLDGTLLGRAACLLADGAGEPSMDAAAAITRLNAAGLTVVICSGRNGKQLMEITRLVGWSDFIAELGCVRSYRRGARRVYDTGTWNDSLLEDGETPYEAIIRVGALDRLQDRFPGLIEYHAPWHLDREVTHVLRGSIDVTEAQSILDTLPLPVTLYDNGVIHPPHHTLGQVDQIHAYHLVPTGVSKQLAIARDLKERGLDPGRALAIGDSATDVAMADSVGLMVVVGNGLQDGALIEEARRRDNVAVTHGTYGTGWAELADAWLESHAE